MGDAQKAFRRSYITSALVCGRNPKKVASEMGHASLRMITEQYETFLDDESWPDEPELARLDAIYGWQDATPRTIAKAEKAAELAPPLHPPAPTSPNEEVPPSQVAGGTEKAGARDQIRTVGKEMRAWIPLKNFD